jgi:Chemotaxis response regulator containing a CheY-like receiver domain and a methylesterase domain
MTRILVVDDSPFIRKAITRIFSGQPDMQVVGTAQSGEEALERLPATRPHVVTLDVEMPGMGGLATLREIQRRYPGLPVIMLSAHTQEGAETTLDAISAGAVDFIDKSRLNVMDFDRLSHELVAKIEVWKQAPHAYSWERARAATPRPRALQGGASIPDVCWSSYDLCVIGASTGGPPALQQIVSHVPQDFPLPIAVVQHMPVGFTRPFAERLNSVGHIRVKEASDCNTLQPGHMLLASAGAHLIIEPDLTAHLSLDPMTAVHIPSVDVLMASANRARPGRVVGILLTGMGDDGAEGMLAIHASGGLTLAESEASCVVYGMPRAAHKRGAVSHMLSLPEICQLFAARSDDP